MNKATKLLEELREMHKTLRSKNGCPWDKKQTIESFAHYLEEETAEIMEEVKTKNYNAMKSELGDLLWNIMFICQMAQEKGLFTLEDIMESAEKKMKKRHPHVFGDLKLETPEEVEKHWEKTK